MESEGQGWPRPNDEEDINDSASFQRLYTDICTNWKNGRYKCKQHPVCTNAGIRKSIYEISRTAWINFSRQACQQRHYVNGNSNPMLASRPRNLEKSRLHLKKFCAPFHVIQPKSVAAAVNRKRQGDFVKQLLDACDNHNEHFHLKQLFFISLAVSKILITLGLLSILLYGTFLFHKPTESFVLRNTQDWIYPLMRRLRLVGLALLSHGAALTEFYEESCLLPNAYFTVDSVECWSCQSIHQVMDFGYVTALPIEFSDSGITFVVKDHSLIPCGIDTILTIYYHNKECFAKEYLISNFPNLNSFSKLMKTPGILSEDEFHLTWTINRAAVARTLRRYISKPFFVPNATEVSIQHFLFVDHWKGKSYSLPLAEFTNMYVSQLAGERYYVLIPTFDCQSTCNVVSIVLHPRDTLFYNWLYWRAISVAVPTEFPNSTLSKNLSISYVGSFY